MQEPDSILSQHPVTRLAKLEAQNIAEHFASHASRLRHVSDSWLAKLENRIIEYLLVRRLKRGLTSTSNESNVQQILDEMRDAYATGAMETLPSFYPTPAGFNYAPETDQTNDFRPKKAARRSILYTSGGGFLFPLSKKQKLMIQRMAEGIQCEIIPGAHRLAPEHPFPTAPHDVADQYEQLLEDGYENELLFMGGDTAGASVTMGALQIIQKRKLPDPAGIILFAPWCDLSMSGWSYITGSVTGQSPFRMETAAFCARVYLQQASPTDPIASAVFAEVTNWPPILIHTSKYDLHFDDAIKLAELGVEQGCDVKLNYWDSPRHHLERLTSADATASFQQVRKFIEKNAGLT